MILFDVMGETGTTGFCNVIIPKGLLTTEDNWTILVDGTSVTPNVNDDQNNSYIYFNYQHSANIEIIGTDAIPEFPSWTPLLILLVIGVAVTITYKRKLQN